MQIKIAERLRPYSHAPETDSMLPGSSYRVKIFPCLIRFYDLLESENSVVQEWIVDVEGPVKEFTVLNDLEKNETRVWGETKKGFFRYRLKADSAKQSIELKVDKAPSGGLFVKSNRLFFKQDDQKAIGLMETFLHPSDSIYLKTSERALIDCAPASNERLSLGNHQAQDWELVKRRKNLAEILPVWNRLGQLVPKANETSFKGGTASLLADCEQAIEGGRPELIAQPFMNLFQAGFRGLLVPRLEDDQHQGIVMNRADCGSFSPLLLLTEGAQLIRRLFIQENEPNHLSLLPSLPPEFHCGRFLGVKTQSGILDMEWSKKAIRRVILYSLIDGEFVLNAKKNSRFRMRSRKGDKGRGVEQGSSLFLEKNHYYFFDNFA